MDTLTPPRVVWPKRDDRAVCAEAQRTGIAGATVGETLTLGVRERANLCPAVAKRLDSLRVLGVLFVIHSFMGRVADKLPFAP